MLTIRGYRRRRGWAAWMTARLGRFDFDDGFPELHEITGDRAPVAQEQTGDEMDAIMERWAAATVHMSTGSPPPLEQP